MVWPCGVSMLPNGCSAPSRRWWPVAWRVVCIPRTHLRLPPSRWHTAESPGGLWLYKYDSVWPFHLVFWWVKTVKWHLLQLLSRKCKCKGKHISNQMQSIGQSRIDTSVEHGVALSGKYCGLWRQGQIGQVAEGGSNGETSKKVWIFLPSVQALAERNDAKPPRVKAFVAYGYTPAEGLQSWGIEFHRIHRPWCWWVDACYTFIRIHTVDVDLIHFRTSFLIRRPQGEAINWGPIAENDNQMTCSLWRLLHCRWMVRHESKARKLRVWVLFWFVHLMIEVVSFIWCVLNPNWVVEINHGS